MFVSSVDPTSSAALRILQTRMLSYYAQTAYHQEWIAGCNANWTDEQAAQLKLCKRIPVSSTVIEIGYGTGTAADEIRRRVPSLMYVGVDLPVPSIDPPDPFAAALAQALPIRSDVADAVISMYTIEHLVYPAICLDEMWRILKPGGSLLLVSPDFCRRGMASEKAGFSYGSGRDKLRQGRILDAIVTGFGTRLRTPFVRRKRARAVAAGRWTFPILLDPLCLSLEGFTPDCDAVYPACPEEMINYLRSKHEVRSTDIYHRDQGTFGLEIVKA